MPAASPPAVTRFAPSPTGHLHIGGARTALFNWALARRLGGHFLLRIEDTDRARDAGPESVVGILRGLEWLGIDWDEGPAPDLSADRDPRGVGPFRQSERRALYDDAARRLLEADLAYHAFETPDELAAMRDLAKREKRPFRYDRAALRIPRAERFARAESEPHVVRFRAPEEEVVVRDEVLGEVRLAPGEVDDFVIVKADGFPTYHLAVVVDDEAMGVTHVVRGQEHLINTPRHVLLQRALGCRTPIYAHLPLIVSPSGAKMSKRDKDRTVRRACRDAGLAEPPPGTVEPAVFARWLADKNRQMEQGALARLAAALGVTLPEIDVEDFRAAGYLPRVVANYIALLGFSPGGDVEKFDLAFLAERFDLARIGKTGARFDYKKLLAFNTDAIAAMSDEDFAERWRAWCLEFAPEVVRAAGAEAGVSPTWRVLAAALRPRSKTFADAARGAGFLVTPDDEIAYDRKAVDKALLKNDGEGLAVLRDLRRTLAGLTDWSAPGVGAALGAFAEGRGVGLGKVAQPLRVALTGSTVSPPIDATAALLGRDRCLARIDRCLAAVDRGRFDGS
ncbi:MAG: glutamate--tRNA ligase [Planctomycetota bacterium]|nr:MAG: glutamate--tRNA ligase [Planctomycetota bacterium]